jgi:recombination protein RecA
MFPEMGVYLGSMAKKIENEKPVGMDNVIAQLEKKFGLQSVKPKESDVVGTGSYYLNLATGIGGYPRGKIIEIYGPESSGKSTISLHAIVENQRAFPDKSVALFDYENSFDKNYAYSLGVDLAKLRIYQPDNQEQGYDMILGLVESGFCSLIIIDSHTSAIPKAIIEGDMSDATMGLQARNNSKFLGKIKGILARSGTTLFAISQTRNQIGGMSNTGPVSTGGNAWKFYADMRLKVWKELKKENESNWTTVDVIKNKCAPPFGQAKFNIVWGEGIDNYGEIIEMGVELGVIQKSGSWLAIGEIKVQGAEKLKAYFQDNPDFYREIKKEVLDKSNLLNTVQKAMDTIGGEDNA